MNTDTDRDRGILSDADRNYLLGEVEMSHEQSKRNAEARIRRRITNGILDFDLFVHLLDESSRRQVFQQATEDEAVLDGLAAMLSFAYLGLKEQGIEFDQVLVPAVRAAEEAYAAGAQAANVTVDVTFEVETDAGPTIDRIAERVADDELVTPRQLFSLVVGGGHDLIGHDRIRLRLTGDDAHHDEDEFLRRLADYLDASVERPTDSRAVLSWEK